MNGYNPIRWDCEKQGCFNIKLRPKIELFADCFPGKISFGDIDGIVEVNNSFLLLEWKSNRHSGIPLGQQILYQRLSSLKNFIVIIVVGSPETMEIAEISVYKHGKESGFYPIDFDTFKNKITQWAINAKR